MKWFTGIILLSALLSIAPTHVAQASEDYWAAATLKPELILVGELTLVSRSSYERPGYRDFAGSERVRVFDSGHISVDAILWGDESIMGVPITWQSGTRLEPPVDDHWVWSSGSRSIGIGERGIWVIWPKEDDSCRLDNRFYTFQFLTMDWLEKVRIDIVEYLHEE
ncbi:MAG: hypothetical protein GY838_02645 [bacterium]|nr:hypothetical protein [bacterium]